MFFWGFFGSSLFVRDSPKLNIYQLSSGKVNLWPSQPLVDLHQGRAGKHGPSTNDATFKIWVLREVCEGECMEDELLGKGDVVCGSPSSSSDLWSRVRTVMQIVYARNHVSWFIHLSLSVHYCSNALKKYNKTRSTWILYLKLRCPSRKYPQKQPLRTSLKADSAAMAWPSDGGKTSHQRLKFPENCWGQVSGLNTL